MDLIKKKNFKIKTIPPPKLLIHPENQQIGLPHQPNQSPLFFFDSSDRYISNILLEHGWKQTNSESRCCELKWTWMPKLKMYNELNPNESMNHFKESFQLTTKLGLKKTLQSKHNCYINSHGKSFDDFYPRSYDLKEEVETFIEDFNKTAILNLTKKLMIHIELVDENLVAKLKKQHEKKPPMTEDLLTQNFTTAIMNKQIFQNDINPTNKQDKRHSTNKKVEVNGKIFINLMLYLCKQISLDLHQQIYDLKQVQITELIAYSKLNPPYVSLKEHFQGNNSYRCVLTIQALDLFFQIYKNYLRKITSFASDGLSNIWVIKASSSSRGRHIFLVDSVKDALVYNNGTRVIQKYIENVWVFHSEDVETMRKYPFLSRLLHKKFDLRLWVLVKAFDPIEAYLYDEGYLRISQQNYQLQDIDRNKTHLTNFNVNWKHAPNQQDSYVLLTQFIHFLANQKYVDAAKFKQQLQMIVLHTLFYADHSITRKSHSKNKQFQLFGFDIILDAELKPWLLEVNMSPACQERGKLKSIVEAMGKGLLAKMNFIPSNQHQAKWIRLQQKQECQKIQTINKNQTCPSSSTIQSTIKHIQNHQNNSNNKILHTVSSESKEKFYYLKNEVVKSEHKFKSTNFGIFDERSTLCDLKIQGVKSDCLRYFKYMEHYLNSLQKVLYLQRFFKKKYKKQHLIKESRKPSLICLSLIEIINQLKRKMLKKGIKMLRRNQKYAKRSEKQNRNKFSEQKSIPRRRDNVFT